MGPIRIRPLRRDDGCRAVKLVEDEVRDVLRALADDQNLAAPVE